MDRQKDRRNGLMIVCAYLLALLFCAGVMLRIYGCPAVLETDMPEDALPPGDDAPLVIGVAAMLSPEKGFIYYQELADYLAEDKQKSLIVRPSYAQVRQDLERGVVDLAIVCTGTYLFTPKEAIEPLAMPILKYPYRSLIIVRKDSTYNRLEDLQGKNFGISDRESNTGCLAPFSAFSSVTDNVRNFVEPVYTGSHDISIREVENKHIDAAGVDATIFFQLWPDRKTSPFHIIWQSEEFGSPPVVAPAGRADNERIRQRLLTMHETEEGRAILAGIGTRKFVPFDKSAYAGAERQYREVVRKGGCW